MKTRSSRVTAFFMLALICAVLVIYRIGWFDVSFFVRPAPETEDADDGDGTNAPDTDAESDLILDTPDSVTTDLTSESSDSATDSSSGGSSEDVGAPEFKFATVADVDADYSRSYDEWESTNEWVLAKTNFETPGYFSSQKRKVYTVSYQPQKDNSLYKPVYTEKEEDKPAVTLYMGYIIVETKKDGRSNIYSEQKRKLIGSFDDEKITPAWCRDSESRPLFIYKDAYYYLDEKKKQFVESDYDPVTDSRGANFDYTPDYGVDDDDRTFLSTSETVYIYEPIKGKFDEEGYQLAYKIPTIQYTYALADKKGKAMTEYVYYGRYPFSESRAAVIDEEGQLYYINKSGKVAIKMSKVRNDAILGYRVYEFYAPPITNGAESIGFYYFDHGLVRIRLVTLDNRYYSNKHKTIYVVSDEDILIYENGDRFLTPDGYNIKAYSSGMILLERDGKYGYMDYTGAWVVEPTLTYAEPFYEGLAVIGKGNERALIDRNGAYVIPFGEYSYISNASMGILAVYAEDEGWSVLYKMKKD